MKISKVNNNVYIIDNRDRIFRLYAKFPSMRVGLGISVPNDETEHEILNRAVQCNREFSDLIRAQFGDDGCGKDGNYHDVCKILTRYIGISQTDLDVMFDYSKDAIDLCKELEDQRFNTHLYRDCFTYLKKWHGDKERAKKFINRFCGGWDGTLVDVFPSKEDMERPTYQSEYWLFREFHNSWGDRLDKIIKDAVEKYPSFDDIDLAGYYVDDCLDELRHMK